MTVRRLKTYTAETGFVYQYYFVGSRPALHEQSTEYVFDVTSDRKTTFAISVFLQRCAVEKWERRHGRRLVEAEQYASVKMRLFAAFDEVEKLQQEGRTLAIGPEDMEELLAKVGVD